MSRPPLASIPPAAFQSIAWILWILGLLACIFFIDRPVALLCFRAFGHTPLRFLLDRYLLPLEALAFLSFLPFCRVRHLIAAALASGVSLAVSEILKWLIGRSRPDPVFLAFHEYGVHPLHASLWWSSFPSGTASVTCALASVFALALPRVRHAVTAVAMIVCALVLLANAHWLSDLLAGAWLGITCGRLAFIRLSEKAVILA